MTEIALCKEGICVADDDCILIMWRKPKEAIYKILCHMHHTHADSQHLHTKEHILCMLSTLSIN